MPFVGVVLLGYPLLVDVSGRVADERMVRPQYRHTCGVEIVSVDRRDQSWEIDSPRYRVYFWDAAATSYEYEVSQADDVAEVMAWADAERGTRTFTLYACVQHDGLGLVRLAGIDPTRAAHGR